MPTRSGALSAGPVSHMRPDNALDDLVVAGAVAVGALLAEAGDAGVHEPWVLARQRAVAHPQAVLEVGLVVLDQHVRPRRQALDHGHPRGSCRLTATLRLLRCR